MTAVWILLAIAGLAVVLRAIFAILELNNDLRDLAEQLDHDQVIENTRPRARINVIRK